MSIRTNILLLLTVLFFNNFSFAENNKKNIHEGGLQITGYYSYDEPHFMYNRSSLEDHIFENFGLTYNFKQQRIINEYLYEFELDTDFKRIEYDYWSDVTGTDENIDNDIYNIRLLSGIQLSENIKFKTGYGYRYLKDHHGGLRTTTGHYGYDRIQEYQYIPFIAEINAPVNSNNGLLKIEYDHIFYGKNKSKLGQVPGNSDLSFRNDDGHMVKTSYKFSFNDLNFEPYYVFQSVEESNVNSSSVEPSNITNEYGLKISKIFGENEKQLNDYRPLINEKTDFYFGPGLLFTRIDTGFHTPTGTATIDEKELGYKIYSGLNANNLNLEFSYNNFGDATISTPTTGDTIVDGDGKFQNGSYDPGTILTALSNNVAINIHSQSVSFALGPTFNQKLFQITPKIGIHRWDQSEHTVTKNVSTTTYDYSGTDLIYGIGIRSNSDNNFSLSLEYAEYPMYYDAKATEVKIGYKF